MANNTHVNKVEYGNQTLIDLTGDTVDANSLLRGVTAHDRSGAAITGLVDTIPTFIGVRYHASLVDFPTYPCWEDLTSSEQAQYLRVIFVEDGGYGNSYDIPYNNTNVGDKLDALTTDLGSKSSASGVTGTDAFAKIATLNTQLSDLNASKVSFSAMGTDNTYSGEASTIKNAIHMLNTNRSTFPQAKVFTTTFQSGGVHTIIGKFYESQYNYGNFIMLTLNGEVVSLKYYDGNWSYKYVSGADGYTAFNPT